MHPVSEIAKPRTGAFAVELLDPGVVVASRDSGAGNGDPVLGAAVLEGDLDGLVVVNVHEFVRVRVGEEEEVRANALGDGHGAGDGPDAAADGGEQASFEAVAGFVEVLDLVFLGGFVIPLVIDCGIGLGVDLGLLERVGHLEGGGCGE